MQVVLVTLPGTDVDGIVKEVHRQTAQLPRGSTVEAALSHSCVVQASSQQEAASISNRHVLGSGCLARIVSNLDQPACFCCSRSKMSWAYMRIHHQVQQQGRCGLLPPGHGSPAHCHHTKVFDPIISHAWLMMQVCTRAPDCEHRGRRGVAAPAGECRLHLSGPLDP